MLEGGQEVEIKARQIEIYCIELMSINKENLEIAFRVSCSKGTYIRSLCEDIATELGTVGYMKELNRTKVGEFNIEQAVTIDELQNNVDNKVFLNEHFISLEDIFKDCNSIDLNTRKLKFFLNGVQLTYDLPNGLYKVYCNENFIGTGTIKEKLLKRDIIR
jgi:tRNA pseudouridine55 synthase